MGETAPRKTLQNVQRKSERLLGEHSPPRPVVYHAVQWVTGEGPFPTVLTLIPSLTEQ